MHIELISPAALASRAAELAGLLRDAVEHGASIGFTLPLAETELTDYWRKIGAEVAASGKILLAALDENGRVTGSAQLALESRANGRHRAEVQKVMVWAAQRGRRLLFLDTSAGESGAVQFYARLGYALAGSIPDYASDPDGRLVPNAIFYKQLT